VTTELQMDLFSVMSVAIETNNFWGRDQLSRISILSFYDYGNSHTTWTV